SRGCGRTSHQILVSSSARPKSTRRSTHPSHSSYEENAGAPPARGSSPSTGARFERRPVQEPAYQGEFTDSASTTGSQGETASRHCQQDSADGMPTCTCSP